MRWRTLRWAKQSLRTKITVVNVVLLTFGLLVSGLGTLALLRPSLVDQLDKQLLAAQRDPSILTGGATDADPCESAGGVQATGRTFYIACLNDQGIVVTQNWHGNEQTNQPNVSSIRGELNELDRTGAPFTLEDNRGRQSWRAVITSTAGTNSDASATRLIVALPLSNVNATITNFVVIFFSFGLAVVLLGAALTRLLVSSTLAPLREVEETAAAIAAGDYSQRLAGATPNTEVGRLNRSLNIMLNRIDKAFNDRQKTIAQMRRFIGDASHELRTPLVTVRGYAELHRMGAITSDDDVEQAFQRIEGEAKRMTGLVEDLLQLARLDESNRQMEFAPVDLEMIAYDAAMDTRAAAPGRTVTPLPLRTIDDPRTSPIDLPPQTNAESSSFFRSERKKRRAKREEEKVREAAQLNTSPREQGPESDPYDSDEIPAMAWANEDKIRQSVQNIIGNALRYTPEGSPLEIGAVVDEAHKKVMIEVIDHGEGIPEPIRNKIFERFWRADTSRTRDTGGSGLGLAIVSAIVKAHSGTVHIIETPGGGATFQIELPLLESLEGPNSSTGDIPRAP